VHDGRRYLPIPNLELPQHFFTLSARHLPNCMLLFTTFRRNRPPLNATTRSKERIPILRLLRRQVYGGTRRYCTNEQGVVFPENCGRRDISWGAGSNSEETSLSTRLHPLPSSYQSHIYLHPRTQDDPLRYHSYFVTTVLESPTSTRRLMEVVAHSRLGTAIEKPHLLCGCDDENRVVTYFSIKWAGFG
jgi:hypothetical protein